MAGGEEAKKGDGEKKIDMLYHLGSSDGPGNIITPIQLRGENYDEWARAIRTSLKAKRKFGFVEGTVPKPTTEDKLEDWITVHSMLVSWLTNTIDPSVRSTLGEYDDAQLLWNSLKNRFCVVNGTRICQLKSSLGECKQGKTETVVVYFGRLSKIWDELTTYVKTPVCKCGNCKCDIVGQVEQLREEDRLHYFLIGLDGAYSSIRTTLLGQETLPNLDRAYQQVIQAERLRGGEMSPSKDERDRVMAFKIQPDARGKSRFADISDKFCNHCNREGVVPRHDKSICFQLHGFPEWWGDRPRGGRGTGRGGGTTGKGSRGQGRGTGAPPVRANKVSGAGQQNGNSQESGSATEAAGLTGISATQLQQLLDYLNVAKTKDRLQGKNSNFNWIIDTGASNHVTCDFSVLRNVRTIHRCPVGLPNGNTVEADKEGSVVLPGGLTLDNVLYVPQLTCNLISVSQLSNESNCVVQFTNNLCVIQDRPTRTVIGAGEISDGLYFFRGVPRVEALAVNGNSTFTLWHQRMGHPSEKMLKLLLVVSDFCRKNNSACDVCHRNLDLVFQLA